MAPLLPPVFQNDDSGQHLCKVVAGGEFSDKTGESEKWPLHRYHMRLKLVNWYATPDAERPMDSYRNIENQCSLRVVRRIASGGMGTVSEAIQLGAGGFEKRVAIKEILRSSVHKPGFEEMFVDEAKLVANLVHENIVQIYQLNRCETGLYIVMELVHGLALSDFIQQHKLDGAVTHTIPTELAVFIVSRIARGLAYAHSRCDVDGTALNIVHRDVCPRNILITTEGLPKLGDFGIANASNMESGDGGFVGKLSYVSPEQASARPIDFRSDIFSLGAVLFELLTLVSCRLKWDDELFKAASEGWIDWDLLPEDLDRRLLRILETMLAVDIDKRYRSTDELAHDLEYFIYSSGYGPTVVTLEKYMRQVAPWLYRVNSNTEPVSARHQFTSDAPTQIGPRDQTST